MFSFRKKRMYTEDMVSERTPTKLKFIDGTELDAVPCDDCHECYLYHPTSDNWCTRLADETKQCRRLYRGSNYYREQVWTNRKEKIQMVKRIVSTVVMSVAALLLLIGGYSSINVVRTGHCGVKVRFGKVVGDSLKSDIYFVNPITTGIKQVNVRTTQSEIKTECYTRDIQQATLLLNVIYNADSEMVHELYRKVGNDWYSKILVPRVIQSVKDTVGKYEASDLIGKRDVAAQEIKTKLKESLVGEGVEIQDIVLADISYSEQFEKAIEEKQIAQQDAIKAKNKTVEVEEVARQTVLKAKAEADAKEAQGKAEAAVVEMKGKAEASAIEAKALAEAKGLTARTEIIQKNPQLIQHDAVSKWDGKMPVNMYGSAPVPFINIPNQ